MVLTWIIVHLKRDGNKYISSNCPGVWDRYGKYSYSNEFPSFNIKYKQRVKLELGETTINDYLYRIVYVDERAFGYRDGVPGVFDLYGEVLCTMSKTVN